MINKKQLIKEIKKQCSYIHNHESFIENILKPVKKCIPHDAQGITGFDEETVNARGIYYDIPTKYLSDVYKINLEDIRHVKRSYELCMRDGYNTSTTESFGLDFKEDKEYKILYEPHGFKHGMQTYFLSESGVFIGFTGLIKKTSPGFNDEEFKLWEQIAPYIMHAFIKYRWLTNMEFFTRSSLEGVGFSAFLINTDGKILWSNSLAKENISEIKNSNKLPDELIPYIENIKNFSQDEHNPFIYRDVKISTSYGTILSFMVDKTSLNHFNINDEGILFVIDMDYLNANVVNSLTSREKNILKLVGNGKTDKEIAYKLDISVKTVNTHIRNIFSKLNVSNRSEAAVKAVKLGVI